MKKKIDKYRHSDILRYETGRADDLSSRNTQRRGAAHNVRGVWCVVCGLACLTDTSINSTDTSINRGTRAHNVRGVGCVVLRV